MACPVEIAWCASWVNAEQLDRQAEPMLKNGYGRYLMQVVRERVY
jgi:glucose-1-phosphate thymidylyltransferase